MNHKYRTRIQGESLQEKIRDYEFKVTEQVMLPAFFAALTLFMWYVYFAAVKIDLFFAVVFSIITLLLVIRAFVKVKKIRLMLKRYHKGLEGERLVGVGLRERTDIRHRVHELRARST